MRSLLDALQEGRLVELPESSKADALEFLAILIEAIPDIGAQGQALAALPGTAATFIPFKLLLIKSQAVVLSADSPLTESLESATDLQKKIDAGAYFTVGNYQAAVLSETGFCLERKLIEAVAVKLEG
jgi:hypothetical protein